MAQIITRKSDQLHSYWQKELSEVVTHPDELFELLQLTAEQCKFSASARGAFALRVPRHYLSKIRPADPRDPLLLQVLPSLQEERVVSGYSIDPIAEQQSARPGLLHKYRSRVLLVFRGGCAINCRYCFRRHFPYQQNQLGREQLHEAINYIAQHEELNEVILSGGDPLMAKDHQLERLIKELETISHIKRLRIHSRLPVVIPSRMDESFAALFQKSSLQSILVFHINHPREIDEHVAKGCARLKAAGVTLLNQSVLLKGVNDDAQVLCELSESLFSAGIQPYYLHQLDKVQGAAHFSVSDEVARHLMQALFNQLPGFLVPRLMREIGGKGSKTPIDLYLHP